MKTINLFLGLFFIIGCTKPNDRNTEQIDPKPITFRFVLVDSANNNLFFGDSAVYDAKNVEFAIRQDSSLIPNQWFNVIDSSYFEISGMYGRPSEPYLFYFEFISDDIDTIKISHTKNSNNESNIFQYDAYFNENSICVNCSYNKIYKIIKK